MHHKAKSQRYGWIIPKELYFGGPPLAVKTVVAMSSTLRELPGVRRAALPQQKKEKKVE